MSLQEIENIVALVGGLSALDRVGLMEVLQGALDLECITCSNCGVEPASVCDGCFEDAFDYGVSEAAFAAETVRRPAKAVK